MQTPASGMHFERLNLERLYRSLNDSLGHPADDNEVSGAIKVTLDEFHHMLDLMRGINIGSFWEIKKQRDDDDDPLIGYFPILSETSGLVLRKSEIREILAKAIEELPQMERLVTSLYYDDELTLREIGMVLGIDETGAVRLYIKAMLRLRSSFSM